ncbi:DUF5304 domain-containing protein [Nocardioides alcanivorans]|uniref:DUF5304 domain-containing protein n=1 Tax=Nocardioides alcanivorans TaxID=2897352 RepID=UPI001F168BE8|nr:DUF5304 domain-containing protein [Nocardioides alcanivorans]
MNEDEGHVPPGADGAQNSGEGAEPIGSVAEEALKLFGALSDWAKDQGDGLGDGVSGMAAGAAQAFHEVNEHIATGSEECKYCPVCRAVHTVRELSPEVKAHLAVAGSNLLQAAAALMATATSDPAREQGRRDDGVEHIPVDEDWPET